MSSLNICIPSVEERADKLSSLIERIEYLAKGYDVRVIYAVDNKQISIGAKRQQLLDACTAEYMVQIDDDDDIPDDYFDLVMPLLGFNADCIGYYEQVVGMGAVKHSITCKQWTDKPLQRTPFYKTPIRTELARIVGFRNKRYGEDHLFAKDIYPFLKKEIFIDKALYIYYPPAPMNKQEHNKRYGIR